MTAVFETDLHKEPFMQAGKFNLVIDGQWGSTGKGNIATFLAWKYGVKCASTTNLPNAGHTAICNVNGKEYKFISKVIPASCILNKLGYDMRCYIGAGAGFTVERLMQELRECDYISDELPTSKKVHIHPRAMIVTEDHAKMERTDTKHIASTMQGSGAVQAEKLMRGAEVKLARDMLDWGVVTNQDAQGDVYPLFSEQVILMMKNEYTWLHEGSQGFSLGVNHGSHYPQCTSRECTPMQMMADMGVPHQWAGDIYMVIRPFPIRVGNVMEDGKTVGYSGDCYPHQNEITWEQVTREAGAPPLVAKGELTTVTKRLRRVFSYSATQLQYAVMVTGATKIALNFANYLDWDCYGTNDPGRLSTKVTDFIKKVEDDAGIPVTVVGTGPDSMHHVMELT